MLRKWGSAAVAAAMIVSSSTVAFGATTSVNQGPLAPGSAAGVHQAQAFAGPNAWLWLLGAGVVIGGIVLVTSGHNHHHNTSTTTTSTP
jgi:hypothetical protein